jgi:WD40 repeat protein
MKQVRLSYTAVAINLEVSPKYIVVSLDDKTVRVFDSGGELLHLLKHEAIVWSLAIHDNMLLCGEIGGGIQSWDLLGGSVSDSSRSLSLNYG